MYRALGLTFFLFCFFFSDGQYAGYTLLTHVETFKKSFAEATVAVESIQSDFKQEKTLSLLSENINATGKFWYQKNDKLRMEYRQPYSYLMILNGGKIFIR